MLELLVVIGVMLILIGMVVSSLSGLGAQWRLRNSTERVANMIALARSRAISDHAIYHVRIANRSADEQWVGVYRFPHAADALTAATEADVQELAERRKKGESKGWNPRSIQGNYTNFLVERQPLDRGVYFETQYNPATLWNSNRNRPKQLIQVHPSPGGNAELYYSGVAEPPAYLTANPLSFLPKITPPSESGPFPVEGKLLFFRPDGSASENVTLLLRDETALSWVQVWKGGIIKLGDINKTSDFGGLYR
jgi:type II secretory pathway pseudopilin PulG